MAVITKKVGKKLAKRINVYDQGEEKNRAGSCFLIFPLTRIFSTPLNRRIFSTPSLPDFF